MVPNSILRVFHPNILSSLRPGFAGRRSINPGDEDAASLPRRERRRGGARRPWPGRNDGHGAADCAAIQTPADLRRERDDLAASLHACEQRLRVFLGRGVTLAFVLDRDLRYAWVHSNDSRLPAEALLGKTDADVYDPPSAAALTELNRAVLATERPHCTEVTVSIAWEERIVECAIEPYCDENGAVTGLIGTHVDVTSQRQIEHELRASEERFRALAENAQDIIYRYRLHPKPAYEYVSPSATRITGFTPAEAYDNPHIALDRVHPDDRELMTALIREPDRHTEPVVLRWRRKDGALIWIEQRNTPVRDAAGRIVAIEGIARDITEQRRLEEEFRELARLPAENPNPILRVAADGRILFRNAAATRLIPEWAEVGYMPADLHSLVTSALETGEVRQWELPVGGRVFASVCAPFPDAGYANIYTTDITERKRLDDDLRMSEARFRLAVDASDIAVAVFDRDLRYVWVYNPLFTFGESAADIVGKRAEEIWLPEDAAQLTALRREVMTTGNRVRRRLDLTIDGERRSFEVASEPLRDAGDEIDGVISAFIDVTERQRMEDTLRESETSFRVAIDAARAALSILDLDLRYLWVYNRLIPYAGDIEIVGKKAEDVWSASNAAKLSEVRRQAIETGERIRRRIQMDIDGELRWLEITCEAIRDARGDTRGVVSALVDVTDRQRIEDALRASEERFRIAVAASPLLLSMLDRDLRYTWAHSAGVRDAPAAASIIGKRAEEILPPEEAAHLTAIRREVLETGVGTTREFQATFSGELRTFEAKTEPLRDSGGAIVGVISAAVDVTERKAMEDALRRSEERYRLALRKAPVTLFTQDLDHRYTWFDTARPDIDAEVILGRTDRELMQHEDADRLLALKRRAVESGETVRAEIALAMADSTPIHFDITIEPLRDARDAIIGIAGAAVDITSQKLVEEDLRRAHDELEARTTDLASAYAEQEKALTELSYTAEELALSEERFRSAFEHAPIGIALASLDSAFLKVNRAYCEIVGYSEDELLGTTSLTLTHPDDRAESQERYRQVIEKEILAYRIDKRYIHKDGREIWVLLNGSVVRAPDGRPLYVILQAQDITERKAWETGTRELTTQLRTRLRELTNVNKELESFSYSVSHDLRAPLRRIDGYAQILLEDHAQRIEEDGRHCLDRIRTAAGQMGHLIEALLQLSRVARVELRPRTVDMSALATEILDELRAQQPERKVEISIVPELAAEGDPNLLRLALENLLGNAWKYTRNRERAEISVGVLAGESPRVFFVRDNGAGFDMKNANRLFGAFQRLHTEQEFEGTGVGLATVRRIIHHHGGEIWVDAAIDAGATFYFTIGETPLS